MELTRHIYASSHQITDVSTFDHILQSSRANNVREGVTGALVIGTDHFLQLLEGDRRAIGKCFMRIMQDRRHHDIQVISCSEVKHRLFYEWSMHRIDTSQMKKEILSRYEVGGSSTRSSCRSLRSKTCAGRCRRAPGRHSRREASQM